MGSNVKGFSIFTVCSGIFCISTMDAVAKWLGEFYPVTQLVFVRNLFAVPAIFILALATGGLHKLRPVNIWVHLVRGVLALVATGSFFMGLRYMPLASAWTIAFAGPLFVTAITPLMLKEAVGVWRWCAVIVGFGGVVVVLRPGGQMFQWAALLPLLTAVSEGTLLVMARRYAESEDFAAMVASTFLVPLLITGLVMPFVWIEPAPVHWPAFFTLGVLGGAAVTFLTLAYRMAEASILAPFDYTALIWTLIWGWIIWREWPDATTWLGGAVLVAAGLFILYRETLRRPPEAARERDLKPIQS